MDSVMEPSATTDKYVQYYALNYHYIDKTVF
jgi:hypothetical protein